MADFALLGCAVEDAFAEPGDFMHAFTAQAADAVEVVIEEDCVGTAVVALMLGRESWTGTMAELLIELTAHDRTESSVSKMKDWPKDPTRLSGRLRGLAAILRKAGVEVSFGKASDRSRTKVVELRTIKPADPQRSQSRRRPSPIVDAAVCLSMDARTRQIKAAPTLHAEEERQSKSKKKHCPRRWLCRLVASIVSGQRPQTSFGLRPGCSWGGNPAGGPGSLSAEGVFAKKLFRGGRSS